MYQEYRVTQWHGPLSHGARHRLPGEREPGTKHVITSLNYISVTSKREHLQDLHGLDVKVRCKSVTSIVKNIVKILRKKKQYTN